MAGEYSRSRFYPRDSWTLLRGELTFDGTAGKGAQGFHTIATVTGQVDIKYPRVYCSESLVGGLATIDLGWVGSETIFFELLAVADIVAGDWQIIVQSQAGGASMDDINGMFTEYALSANIRLDVNTADITAGKLRFFIWWRPLSADGKLELGPNLVAI